MNLWQALASDTAGVSILGVQALFWSASEYRRPWVRLPGCMLVIMIAAGLIMRMNP